MRKLSSLFFIFAAFLILSGCSLSEPQEVTVQFIDALFAKPDDGEPTREERIEVLTEVISPSAEGDLDDLGDMLDYFEDIYNRGLIRPYFVAENPLEPQTDDYSSILVHLPKSSFEKSIFGDEYFVVELRNEDGDWKITEFNEFSKSKISAENPPEWIEVEPLD